VIRDFAIDLLQRPPASVAEVWSRRCQ